MFLAPIIIFAFNRLAPLKACVASLLSNVESKDSDLFVFVDGARPSRSGEAEKVGAVRKYVKTITGFKSVSCHFSDVNKGLAASVIGGVTEVINEYGMAIVVEDDLILAPSFLAFMNTMLQGYANDKRIMQISGFSTKIKNYKQYNCDYYMSARAQSWSWATWQDRWNTIDWEVKDFDKLANNKQEQKAFNKYGSDLFGMLKKWRLGLNNSWYIRFCYSMHKQNRFCILPIRSLVYNDGFGNDATHTTCYNRYKIDFLKDNFDWRMVDDLVWNESLAREAVKYWSIPYRIYGKLITMLNNGFKK